MARAKSGKRRRGKLGRRDPADRSVAALAARRVLRDCQLALRDLQSAEPGAAWRLRWVTAITLLRVVGHVLQKVDGERSLHLAQAIETVWAGVKQPRIGNEIFHDFIERERNTILKEYRPDHRAVAPLEAGDGGSLGMLIGSEIVPPTEAVQRAIRWWGRLLVSIENEAQRLRFADRHGVSSICEVNVR